MSARWLPFQETGWLGWGNLSLIGIICYKKWPHSVGAQAFRTQREL